MRPFTDDAHEALRVTVRSFAARALRRPEARGADPRELARTLGAEGLLRFCVPAAHGGAGTNVDPLALVVLREELAYASSLADALLAVQGLSACPLWLAGDEALAARLLPGVATGQRVGAFAVTEPEAGSDLAALRTSARREGDGYVLDGHKTFISNATFADLVFVLARSTPGGEGGEAAGATGTPATFTAFVLPADTPGLETTAQPLLGAHRVGSVRLRGVRAPVDARLGAEGDGLRLALGALEMFRPTVGASALGMARRALDEARRRVQIRKQFGRPLAAQQDVQFALAEMATDLEAARGLVYRAAWQRRQALASGGPARDPGPSSMAKLYATEMAQRVVDRALQLHGAAGLVEGSVLEALYREVRALRIYEGTSEIQKLVIARTLLDTPSRPAHE
jgi:acyl-CoA dehydrogenase